MRRGLMLGVKQIIGAILMNANMILTPFKDTADFYRKQLFMGWFAGELQ